MRRAHFPTLSFKLTGVCGYSYFYCKMFPVQTDIIFWVIYGVVGFGILFGNSLVCAVFLFDYRLRLQHMNAFLVSLGISDILMAVVVLPGYASFCSSTNLLMAHRNKCAFLEIPKDFVFLAGIFNLLAITYDRYLAVLKPLHYSVMMTWKRVVLILIATWIVPLPLSLARMTWLANFPKLTADKISGEYDFVLVFICVLVPILITLAVNLKITKAIRNQKRRINLEPQASQEIRTANEFRRTCRRISEKSKTISCLIVVFVFIISWLPRSLFNLLLNFGGKSFCTDIFAKMSFLCLFLQSFVNPFIYSFSRKDFRQAARRFLDKFRN